MHQSPQEHHNYPLSKFESMLKTNNVFFFDSTEFEEIIQHYLENGKIRLPWLWDKHMKNWMRARLAA